MIWGMIGSKGMENVIDFRKFYDIITAFRCGSTVRDVSAEKSIKLLIEKTVNEAADGVFSFCIRSRVIFYKNTKIYHGFLTSHKRER